MNDANNVNIENNENKNNKQNKNELNYNKIDFQKCAEKICEGTKNRDMIIAIGKCYVEYEGRAMSKLPLGKRMLMIKGDGSIAIHENRLLRPTNYMMNAKINTEIKDNELIVKATKLKPKEKIKIRFYEIYDIRNYELPETNDIRLFGSEKELNDELMQDLSFLEKGLKPLNQQEVFRKGICDIIAEDSQGRLVVIELKRRKADYNSVMQLKRYMQQVSKLKAINTRGILLAPEIGKNARELLEANGMEFFSYEFEIKDNAQNESKSNIKGINKTQKTLGEIFGINK